MRRRTYLASALAATSPLGIGEVGAQSDSQNTNGADYSDVRFGQEQSIGWVDERFIEYDSPDNPAVGMEVSFTAMVLTNLQSEEERLQKANQFQWANFEFAGDRILGSLFEPISWVLDPVQDFTESFYEKFELMKLVGVTEDDQQFYDRYEYVPHIWAAGDEEVFHPSGTIIEATGIVRYANQDSEPMSPGTGEGVYVELTDAEPIDSVRTLGPDTDVGETTRFTGLQYVDEPTLTSYLTEVEYEYESNLPKPEGGALVTQRGQLVESSFDVQSLVRDNSAKLRVTDQQVIVGTTHNQPWDQGSETSTDSNGTEETNTNPDDGSAAPNVVAVVDASTSMEETDTRSGRRRLQVAKENLRSLINYVEQGNRFGLVSFSVNAQTEADLRRIGGVREEFEQAVSEIQTRSDTSIGAGLLRAVELLEDAQGSKSIVLLSDGEENEPPAVSEVLPSITRLGINVYTIGMGSGANRQQLQRLANETGGEFAFAPEPNEIRSLYQQFSIEAQDRSTLTSETISVEGGDSVEGTATVDQSCADTQFTLSHDTNDASLVVERPNGGSLQEQEDVTHRTGTNNEVWTVENPESGEWNYLVNVANTVSEGEVTVEVSSDSSIDGSLFVSDEIFTQTSMVKAQVKMNDQRRRYTGANVTVNAIPVDAEEPTGSTSGSSGDRETSNSTPDTTPTPAEMEIELNDDGRGPDAVEDDGIYTTFFSLPQGGEYEFEAFVEGGEINGLAREMNDSLAIENDPRVDDPIRPYLDESEETLFDSIEQYAGPGAVVLTLVAVLIGALRTMRETN